MNYPLARVPEPAHADPARPAPGLILAAISRSSTRTRGPCCFNPHPLWLASSVEMNA